MEECAQCGKRGDANTIRRCSRCKAIRYCSRDCQALHWSHHKVTCTLTTNPPSSSSSANPNIEAANVLLDQSSHSREPWQQARSMALREFPGNRVVDRFDDIDTRHMEGSTPIVNSMPFSLTPMRTDGVLKEVLVVKLTSSVFNPRLRVWAVEDCEGKGAHVTFSTPVSPAPYFRYEDLQRGHFLCVKNPDVTLFLSGVHFVRVEDASSVRVFRG